MLDPTVDQQGLLVSSTLRTVDVTADTTAARYVDDLPVVFGRKGWQYSRQLIHVYVWQLQNKACPDNRIRLLELKAGFCNQPTRRTRIEWVLQFTVASR